MTLHTPFGTDDVAVLPQASSNCGMQKCPMFTRQVESSMINDTGTRVRGFNTLTELSCMARSPSSGRPGFQFQSIAGSVGTARLGNSNAADPVAVDKSWRRVCMLRY